MAAILIFETLKRGRTKYQLKLDVPISKCYWFQLKSKETYFANMYWLAWISFATTVQNAQKWRQNQDFRVFVIFSAF